MQIVQANTGLEGVRASIAQNALSSFDFFANTVCAASLSEELCSAVQDIVEDEENYTLRVSRPRAIASVIRGWLESRGATVYSAFDFPRTEILAWLQLHDDALRSRTVHIDVVNDGVVLQWL